VYQVGINKGIPTYLSVTDYHSQNAHSKVAVLNKSWTQFILLGINVRFGNNSVHHTQ
jgi:hypothetical protein